MEMSMKITIDEAQQFIISHLRDLQRGVLPLSCANYDVYLDRCVKVYISKHQTQAMVVTQQDRPCYVIFADAVWDLCRKGILRPGINTKNCTAPPSAANGGFSITEYGKEWLLKYKNDDLLPADPNEFTMLFSNFQTQYGLSYFRRAKEAVSSFQLGNFLACCVMSGAAAESILLSAAFAYTDKSAVLKEYLSSGGRRKIENRVFGKTKSHIKDRYINYTGILSYWRDESGHGHDSDIDIHEAYISLLTLLRFSQFMRDHWEEIINTNQHTSITDDPQHVCSPEPATI